MDTQIEYTHFLVTEGEITGYALDGTVGTLISEVFSKYKPYAVPIAIKTVNGVSIEWISMSNFYMWYVSDIGVATLIPNAIPNSSPQLEFYGSYNALVRMKIQLGELIAESEIQYDVDHVDITYVSCGIDVIHLYSLSQ